MQHCDKNKPVGHNRHRENLVPESPRGGHLRTTVLGLLGLLALHGALHAQAVANPQNYTRSSSFEYHTSGPQAGLLRVERVEPNNPNQCVETEHSYDVFGNKTGATTRNCTNRGGSGASASATFETRTNTSEYAGYTVNVKGAVVSVPTGTFPSSGTNALGHGETRVVDPRFGTVVSLTGPNSLVTGYTLDDWGRVVSENRADGTSSRSQHCLIVGRVSSTASNSAACGGTGPLSGRADEIPSGPTSSPGWRAISYVQVQAFSAGNAPMGPPQRVYKDAEGRAIREIAAGFDGGNQPGDRRWVVKDTVYDANGVAVATTGNYFLENGSPATAGDSGRALTTTVVDALGRPVQIHQRDPKGNSSASFGPYGTFSSSRTTVVYSGLTTTTTNDRGRVRVEEKNPNGLLVRATDATGAQLAHQHDAFGNLIATKDALQNTINVTYDTRGRKLSMQDPSAGHWTYGYNALGELAWQQSPNQRVQGQTTTMAYDRLGRMVSRTAPEYTSTWAYDNCAMGKGKLCASGTTHGVNKSFSYDSLGRPTGSRMAVANGPSFNTRLAYQAQTGRLETQTYPTGLQVQYSYTAQGFLNQVVLPQTVQVVADTSPGQPSGPAVTWAAGKLLWAAGRVDARGLSETSTLGNGLTSRASLDGPTGRIDSLSVGAGGATNVAHHTYVWDSIGNLQSRTDHNGDGLTGAVTDTYKYDPLNRLDQYRVEAVNAANLTRTVELHYNAIGNLLYKSDVGNYSYPNFGAGSVRPHAVSQVAMAHETRTYGYDANGNAVSASSGPWRSISYTSFNLPDSNQGAQGPNGLRTTWFYDENQQRIRETRQNGQGTRTTWYLHPDNQGGLGFETESRNGSTNLNRHYVSAGGQMLLIVTRQALTSYAGAGAASPPVVSTLTAVKVEFWHKDHLGSVIASSDHAGQVTARYAYDPFGKRRQANGQYDMHGALVIDWVDGSRSGTDRGYTGHEHLDELGLIHMNGRIFDPTIGRFLQADPFIQAMEELQSYNRYSYCFGNPLNCTDPSGYISLKKLWKKIKPLVAIAAAIYLGPGGWAWGEIGLLAGSGVTSAVAQSAIAGFVSGTISSGNIQGALQGAFSGAVFGQVGEWIHGADVAKNAFHPLTQIAMHGVAGCVSSEVGGGKCGPGALSAAFSKTMTFSTYVRGVSSAALNGSASAMVEGTIIAAVAGGTGSVLGGGKFSNGAQTGAFSYLFNALGSFDSASGSYDDGKERLAGTLTSEQAGEFWGNVGEGAKLGVMWTPTGRGVVTAMDATGAVYSLFAGDGGDKLVAFGSGISIEKVTQGALSTPKSLGFAGRVAGYVGWAVDKLVGAAQQSSSSNRTANSCKEPGKC